MNEPETDSPEGGGDLDGPSPRVAGAAIRDAIEALKGERPEIARRLQELLGEVEAGS